jgi:hypothetical protein
LGAFRLSAPLIFKLATQPVDWLSICRPFSRIRRNAVAKSPGHSKLKDMVGLGPAQPNEVAYSSVKAKIS